MIRLALRVRREDAEVVLAELLELAPAGVEERDDGDAVEYALYGAPGELPALPDVRAAIGGALVDVRTTEVADDWPERWREFHRPVEAGPFFVRPPWADPRPGLVDLVIDPGQAFGTGAHPTTHLSLELLAGLGEHGGPLLDVGCGSGVLAIAAAKLGYRPVLATDHDPLAVEATRANALVNGVELEARRADLRRDPLPAVPTVTANLLKPLLDQLTPRLEAPRHAIVSGLLRSDPFAWPGLREVQRRESGDWAALRLSAPRPD